MVLSTDIHRSRIVDSNVEIPLEIERYSTGNLDPTSKI
jgi:hypothetical protein